MIVNLNVGPLTTIFTPPASCLNVVTSGAGPPFSPTYSLFVGHFGPYEIAQKICYPEGAASINFAYTNFYWSPGYCPQGYSTACAYTTGSFAASVTASLCCPLGFDCAYANWPHVCSSQATTPLTNVFVLTGTTESLPAGYSFSTVKPSPTLTVWNDGIPVAWAATDSEILALLGSTTTSPIKAAPSTSSPAISPTVSIPSSTLSSPSSTSPSPSSKSPLGLTPDSSSSPSKSTSPTGTLATSGPPAPYSSGSSPTNRPSSTSSSPPPSKNSTGLGSNTSAAVSSNGWFSGNRGKGRIALIVAIPIIGLATLLGIFFCFRKYDLSIKRRSPTSSVPKLPAAAPAEADSRARYEIGSGQQQPKPIRSELAGTIPFEIGAGSKSPLQIGQNEMAHNVGRSGLADTSEPDGGYQNYGTQHPPSSPTVPR